MNRDTISLYTRGTLENVREILIEGEPLVNVRGNPLYKGNPP